MKDSARAGGLAVALLDALRRSGGVWFGWSGEISERERRTAEIQHHNALTIATLDLTPDDYEDYYNGFANSTLWPLFHYRLDLATFDREHYQGYVKVNQRFAHTLLPLLKAGDHIWIHDYHLMACGEELQAHGVQLSRWGSSSTSRFRRGRCSPPCRPTTCSCARSSRTTSSASRP